MRAEAAWVHRAALDAGGQGFSEAVLAPLRAGAALQAREYLDAMQARGQVRDELDAIARGVDALVLPTSPVTPPRRGSTEAAVAAGSMTVRQAVLGQTLPFNVAGMPALSLPMGWTQVDGARLPAGLMLAGAVQADARLLALGAWVEAALAGQASTD